MTTLKIQCLGYFTKSNYFLIVSASSGFGEPQSKQMSSTEFIHLLPEFKKNSIELKNIQVPTR